MKRQFSYISQSLTVTISSAVKVTEGSKCTSYMFMALCKTETQINNYKEYHYLTAMTLQANGRPGHNVGPSVGICWPSFCSMFCTFGVSWPSSNMR